MSAFVGCEFPQCDAMPIVEPWIACHYLRRQRLDPFAQGFTASLRQQRFGLAKRQSNCRIPVGGSAVQRKRLVVALCLFEELARLLA